MSTFNDLPQELRLKIWRSTLESRLIVFILSLQNGQWHIKSSPKNTAPTLMRVNSESRAEMLFWHRRIRIYKRLHNNVSLNQSTTDGGIVDSRFTETFFNPARDTLFISKISDTGQARFNPKALIPLITQAHARHVLFHCSFCDMSNFTAILRAISGRRSVETVTFYLPHKYCKRIAVRMARHDGLPETAVASMPPPTPTEILEGEGGRPSVLNTHSKSWTFIPVRETLRRHGAVLFNNHKPNGANRMARLLIVDNTTFPDEFIWGLAARTAAFLRHAPTDPSHPSSTVPMRWKQDIFRLFDGVCVPSFRLGGAPPYNVLGRDNRIYLDTTVAVVARIALKELRMTGCRFPVLGVDVIAKAWEALNRKAWMEAILWGKDVESWEEAREGGHVQTRGTMGGAVGWGERWEIESVVGGILHLRVWNLDESPDNDSEPSPRRAYEYTHDS